MRPGGSTPWFSSAGPVVAPGPTSRGSGLAADQLVGHHEELAPAGSMTGVPVIPTVGRDVAARETGGGHRVGQMGGPDDPPVAADRA